MKILKNIRRFFLRFRYPVSLPEDIASALGVSIPNTLTFSEFIARLSDKHLVPTRLKKFMPREKAETIFALAVRKDRFAHNTLFSYYFPEGWIEFILWFDDQDRLRRLYLQHHGILSDQGVEINLPLNKILLKNSQDSFQPPSFFTE